MTTSTLQSQSRCGHVIKRSRVCARVYSRLCINLIGYDLQDFRLAKFWQSYLIKLLINGAVTRSLPGLTTAWFYIYQNTINSGRHWRRLGWGPGWSSLAHWNKECRQFVLWKIRFVHLRRPKRSPNIFVLQCFNASKKMVRYTTGIPKGIRTQEHWYIGTREWRQSLMRVGPHLL